jgi:hypothetical protein
MKTAARMGHDPTKDLSAAAPGRLSGDRSAPTPYSSSPWCQLRRNEIATFTGGAGSSLAAGKTAPAGVAVKVVPLVSSEVTAISPPWASMISLAIKRRPRRGHVNRRVWNEALARSF